jgi:hypothetical protein
LGAAFWERLTQDKVTAGRHIQVIFAEDCRQQGLNSDDFDGPFLMKSDFWHYEFYWKNRKADQFVLGVVQFFPIRSEVWFLTPGSKIQTRGVD